MKENKEVKISYLAAHFTTIISVTLVLVLVGIIAMVWIGADKETRRMRERIELSVIMHDSISNEAARKLETEIKSQPYALKTTFISKEEAMKQWKRDTGEDLEAVFGVNPLSPEIGFTIKADYSSPRQIESIRKSLSKMPGVADVSVPETDTVEAINRSVSRLTALLGGIAIVMLIISFVLINNTVHLTIYSRRFTIHTMQLVGATNGYIRRPVVNNNLLCGLVAGVIASALIAIALALAPQAGFHELSNVIGWMEFGVVAGSITLVGMIICALAAWSSTARYLGKDYDELFK
ncbi:MAG: permease-like cell division protein FtsX [Muribaculaceae bacterium]|nr:permease-like cell division protein FtsX [Muribaculaceae bacterium]